LRLGHHSDAAIGALQAAKKHKLRFHDEQMQAMRPVTTLFAARGNSGHGFRKKLKFGMTKCVTIWMWKARKRLIGI